MEIIQFDLLLNELEQVSTEEALEQITNSMREVGRKDMCLFDCKSFYKIEQLLPLVFGTVNKNILNNRKGYKITTVINTGNDISIKLANIPCTIDIFDDTCDGIHTTYIRFVTSNNWNKHNPKCYTVCFACSFDKNKLLEGIKSWVN